MAKSGKKKDKDATGVVKAGDNQMPPEMIQQYAAEIVAFDKDIDKVRTDLNSIVGARRNKLKSFKSNGGDQDLLLQVVRELKLDPQELQIRMKTLAYYRDCMNLGKIPGGDLVDQAAAHDYFDKLYSLGLRQAEENMVQPKHDYPIGSDEAKMIEAGFAAKQREKIEAAVSEDGTGYKAPPTRQEWLEQMKVEDAAQADAEADAAVDDSDGGGAESSNATPIPQPNDDGLPLDHGWDEAAPRSAPPGTKLN